MGASIYPVFNPPVPEAVFEADGKVLAIEFEAIDDLAVDLGLASFSSFGDDRPIPEGFDGDPHELADILGDFDDWYPASEGITVFQTIAERIRSDSEASSRFQYPGEVAKELECLTESLQIAKRKDARFHLEMSF